MNELWQHLEAWLATHDPARLADLNPPAGDTAIAALEQLLGKPLPADFTACLKIHDGQRGQAGWLFDDYEFLSSRQITLSRSAWTNLLEGGDFATRTPESDTGIRASWWDKAWLPFASDGGGDYLCLDLAPADQGHYGQVIEVLHDMPQRTLLAPSFADWFGDFIMRKTA